MGIKNILKDNGCCFLKMKTNWLTSQPDFFLYRFAAVEKKSVLSHLSNVFKQGKVYV